MTQKPRNRITQQDVARLAGVSVAAVSLVLGGKGRISPQGVERIYHAIDQLGYRSPSSSSVTTLPRIGVLLMPGCQFATDLLPDLSQGLQGRDSHCYFPTQTPGHFWNMPGNFWRRTYAELLCAENYLMPARKC